MVKIAISGKANSGKNTVANLVGEQFVAYSANPLTTQFKVLGFADPIKEMIMKMYPATNPDILWGASELRMTGVPNTKVTFRQVLMDIGKLGRDYNPNIWIDATISMANIYAKQNNIPIIADCRFKNELKALQDDEFFLLRVIRPNNPYQNSSAAQDISEVDLDQTPDTSFNMVLINDGSISELKQKISDMIRQYFVGKYLPLI